MNRFCIYFHVTGLAVLLCFTQCERRPSTQIVIQDEPTVDGVIDTVLAGGGALSNAKFSTVIQASTGKLIFPVDPTDPADAEIIEGIRAAIKKVLARFNQKNSPTSSEKRINEVSSYFEEALLEEVNAMPELTCEYPRTKEGKLQRSGYPDLRIVHKETGTVTYLDPKLVETGSLDSSLRTFYFTPKKETSKVLDNAHHLLIGIEHDGNTGNWKFLRWHLVDLSDFVVRLKAEFQASNKDLYIPDLLIETGEAE